MRGVDAFGLLKTVDGGRSGGNRFKVSYYYYYYTRPVAMYEIFLETRAPDSSISVPHVCYNNSIMLLRSYSAQPRSPIRNTVIMCNTLRPKKQSNRYDNNNNNNIVVCIFTVSLCYLCANTSRSFRAASK